MTDKNIADLNLSIFLSLKGAIKSSPWGHFIGDAINGDMAALETVNSYPLLRGIMDEYTRLEKIVSLNQSREEEAEKSSLIGKYAYSVNGGRYFPDIFSFDTPQQAMVAAINHINDLYTNTDSQTGRRYEFEFTIGRIVHPVDAAYGARKSIEALGVMIVDQVINSCAKVIDSGSRSFAVNDNAWRAELADAVLKIARQNLKISGYGIANEMIFKHRSGEPVDDRIVRYEAEYIARQDGWVKEHGQIFKIVKSQNNLLKQDIGRAGNILRAGSWIDAAKIARENEASLGLS